MRDGALIALSDLVASTFAIAVLLFLVAFATGTNNEKDLPDKEIARSQVDAAFKEFRGPPLSGDDMVEILFARTAGGRSGVTTIDVFPDRVVFVRHRGTGTDTRVKINRSDLASGRALQLRDEYITNNKDIIYLYNFSNDCLNVLSEYGYLSRLYARILMVPHALYRIRENNSISWSIGFSRLIEGRATYQQFREYLKYMLKENTSYTSARVNEDEKLLSGGGYAFRPEGVISKFIQLIENIVIISLFALFSLVILRMERFS